MDYQRLNEFVTLADTCEFWAASERCGIHKSTLTRRIKDMETELGVPLLDRTTHNVELNDFGTLFLPYAHQLLELEKICRAALAGRNASKENVLRIGTNLGATSSMLTLLSQCENVRLAASADCAEDLLRSLRHNKCDVCLVRKLKHEVYSDMVEIPYCWWQFAAVMPKDHRFAKRETVSLEELQNENLYLLQANHDYIVSVFQELGFKPNVKCTSCDADFIYRSVALGHGVSILLKHPTEARNATGDVAIVDFVPLLTCCDEIIYPKGSETPDIVEFVKFLQNCDTSPHHPFRDT